MLLLATLLSQAALATEDQTIPMLALRLSKIMPDNQTVDFTVNTRINEFFESHERQIAELRYGKRVGATELTAGYNMQFDRNGQSGSEQRPWVQMRRSFALAVSNVESSLRLEERYFTATDRHGERVRWLTRWSKPLPGRNQLRVGYEWVYNLNDISASTLRGPSQDRLIGGWQHTYANNHRFEFEYQMRYLHLVDRPNQRKHQLQFLYVAVF
jgi:Protein of unknown function (DUF2490)